MEKYIKHPKNYTIDQLQNHEWDIIELDCTIDHSKMYNWYCSVVENIPEARFEVTDKFEKKYFDPTLLKRWYAVSPAKQKDQSAHWWGLQWIKERYDPLPFVHLANREIFPEINDESFDEYTNPVLSRYRFGEFENLYQNHPDWFKISRLLVLPKDSGLGVHTDVIFPTVLIRMHIEISINDQSTWFFGNHCERQYILESGKVYLINTGVPHAAINYGDTDWVMIHCTPSPETISEILKHA